jgi:acyl-coenzyme A thioesterase PaaI-like protein
VLLNLRCLTGSAFTTVETKANSSSRITQDTGRVRAEAHIVSKGRQIISSETRLLAPDGRVLAHGTSKIIVLSDGR